MGWGTQRHYTEDKILPGAGNTSSGEMQALQQSMDRLQAIGDLKGRNELVYQFNDRSHRYNSINAEKGRVVSYLNDLINGRNKIASDLNTLQRQR